MSNPNIAVMPVGHEIASFANYKEASAAVDTLADAGYPVQELTIVGTDLKMIEKVTGRITWGKVLLSGAVSGALFGLMLSIFFVLLIPGTTWSLVLMWMLAGAIGFAISQGLLYAMSGGQRDFSSSQGVIATRYGLQATPEHAGRARQLLIDRGVISRPAAPAREIDLTEPPLYGERIDPGEGMPLA
ncbi:MAG TPA: general stress protein [Actinomycetaceae bacterium]|nr:general stress protein [Actinomycetaceae bacterium]